MSTNGSDYNINSLQDEMLQYLNVAFSIDSLETVTFRVDLFGFLSTNTVQSMDIRKLVYLAGLMNSFKTNRNKQSCQVMPQF